MPKILELLFCFLISDSVAVPLGISVNHRCQKNKYGFQESATARFLDWKPECKWDFSNVPALAMKHIDRFQLNIQGKALAKKDHKLTMESSSNNICFIVILTEDMSPRICLI